MVAARQVDAVRRRLRAKVPRLGFESYMLPDSTPLTWVQDRCAPLAPFSHPVAKLKVCFCLSIGVRSRPRSEDPCLVYKVVCMGNLCRIYTNHRLPFPTLLRNLRSVFV